jgi:thiamine biosynthesis lipoprotein
MKSASSEVRRARPLLGTFVDTTAQGSDETKLHHAIDQAFAAVGTVHRLMSFHSAESDVARLNEKALRQPVRVHRWTQSVLRAAKKFSRESNGVFDITIASLLSAWRFLPQMGARGGAGDWRDVVFTRDRRVRFRRRLMIDLGGIAKGFAVDRATEALIAAGVSSGLVNAGGDLRVFGPKARVVHVRHPREPALIGRTIRLRGISLATSALYFSCRQHEKKSPLVDGRTRRPILDEVSLSVYAPDCMTADALTKIALAMGNDASPILNRHRAGSFLLSDDSTACDLNNPTRSQSHQA